MVGSFAWRPCLPPRFARNWPERVAVLGLLSPASGYAIKPGEPYPPKVQARLDDLDRLDPIGLLKRELPGSFMNQAKTRIWSNKFGSPWRPCANLVTAKR